MPYLGSKAGAASEAIPGQRLAILAESLYLINLLLLPGLAFLVLVALYFRTIAQAPSLAACHLRQTLSASLWAGGILVVVNGFIILLGGYTAGTTWVVVILYFVCCHSALVLVGALGLARAMAGQPYRYPVVGRPC
ncbi:MAG: hypothetical protein ACFCVA_05550 [Gammaproteobacteria bacterium]